MSDMETLTASERIDDLCCRGRYIIQRTDEFCFSMDAVLLAHFPRLTGRERVLDLGTGTGVIPLLVADHAAHITAVELSPVQASLAVRNVRMNNLIDKITVREGDYRAPSATLADTVRAAAYALRHGGRLAMVHLPERLSEIVLALHVEGLAVKRLQMVQPRADRPPNLMLLEAVKGASPAGLRNEPALIVRDAEGNYTGEICEIYGQEM